MVGYKIKAAVTSSYINYSKQLLSIMKLILQTAFLFACMTTCLKTQAQRVKIIPEPVTITDKAGDFVFSNNTSLITTTQDTLVRQSMALFSRSFQATTGIRLHQSNPTGSTRGIILVELKPGPPVNNPEGYLLNISPDSIKITAATPAGIFYAFQSLAQLLPADQKKQPQKPWKIPCAYIVDYPQYPYRGMHLDVSRHFFPPAFIKQYIDLLATFKINVFHWHLTDSHGWRLEIKQYPKLTTVGAWRANRDDIPMTVAQATQPGEPATYGGFYTQEAVKDIIAYARQRNVMIIPEIEMPGHCTAALVAYPQYSDLNNNTPLLMPCGYPGDLQHNFCVGYDSTYIFLQNILQEVMALFPAPYIHIGGDEVRPEPWLNCPRCQHKMKENGFTTARQLQAYFTARIDSFITAHGKKMMGWDEILGAAIAPSSVSMSWHGDSKAIAAAARGNATVMTPYQYTYFDFYQSDPGLEPAITYARLQLDTVYHFNPMPRAFTAAQAGSILGGEGCLWTENVPTPQHVEYMLLPRLLALSEALWSPEAKKNYARFITKTETQFHRFDAAGIRYAKSMYNVNIRPVADSAAKSITVTLTDQTYRYPIHYTLDGTTPTVRSPLYEKPVVIHSSAVLKAATFIHNTPAGKINTDTFLLHKAVGATAVIQPAHEAPGRLLDGILGTIEPYDARWMMLTDSLTTVTIRLHRQQLVRSLTARFMEDQVGNLYLPRKINVSVSIDGIHYTDRFTVANALVPQQLLRHVAKYVMPIQQQARYIKISIHNANLHTLADKNIIMLDELVVQ